MEFGCDPFRWWAIRNLIEPMPLDELPGQDWPGWEARYDNDTERRKRTSRDLIGMPGAARKAIAFLRDSFALRFWSESLGYPVEDDPTLHGGGLHVTDPGGWLSTHLDYACHPKLPGKERRINLIAFLNPEWRPEWGGFLQLCDPMGRPVKEFAPEPGLIVAFETGDQSYHGVSQVCGTIPRVTAAVYFLSDLRPGVTRQRALFIPNRGAA